MSTSVFQVNELAGADARDEPEGGGGAGGSGGDDAMELQRDESDAQYRRWVLARMVQARDVLWYRQALAALPRLPRFVLACLVLPGHESSLVDTISVLQRQLLNSWQLILVGFTPCPADLSLPANVRWHELGDDDDSVEVISLLLAASAADWVGLIEVGDRMAPEALASFSLATERHPKWQLMYSDEDVLGEHLRRSSPRFKPEFNLDLLRSCNYIGGLLLIRRELFAGLDGFRPDAEGAEDYDLLFRAYERVGAAGIGHVPEVLYHRCHTGGHVAMEPTELLEVARHIIGEHLQRCGQPAAVLDGPFPGSFEVRYPPHDAALVSIIIPTRDHAGLLRDCVESIRERTTHSRYEIILVDNQTEEPEALALMAEWVAQCWVRVVRYPHPFNYSAQINLGATAAKGEYLVFLNNDCRITNGDWLSEMLRHAQRPEVGVVGARLLYPDGKVQHAGVILGIGHQPAEHPFIGGASEDLGYMGRAQLIQNFSAVTAACLMTPKRVFSEVGGLNQDSLAVAFNDVDYCLRVGQQGHLVVWTPRVELIHGGSVSQKAQESNGEVGAEKTERFRSERDFMFKKWAGLIARDPAYNPNLTLAGRNFAMEMDGVLSCNPEWRPRSRILAHPADHAGCGEYRIKAPMRVLNNMGLVQGWATERIYGPSELMRIQPDCIVLQRQLLDHQLEAVERYRRESDAFLVFEMDDLNDNPPEKAFRKRSVLPELRARLARALKGCDRLVVSTPELADAYGDLASDVRVVHNYIEDAKWGYLQPRRVNGERPRVGWAGGSSHAGDLEMIADVVRILADEVDWVFFGMCPSALQPYVKEFHGAVPIEGYAPKLASLNLDLALAPLENHPFNECKSNLRLLEYGMLGYPVVCTDIAPYRGGFPVWRVKNATADWVDAIRMAVADRDQLMAAGDQLRAYVRQHWLLENSCDRWLEAWLP